MGSFWERRHPCLQVVVGKAPAHIKKHLDNECRQGCLRSSLPASPGEESPRTYKKHLDNECRQGCLRSSLPASRGRESPRTYKKHFDNECRQGCLRSHPDYDRSAKTSHVASKVW